MDIDAEKCNNRVEFVGVSVEDKFSTIGEFLTKIQQVQQTANVQLWNMIPEH